VVITDSGGGAINKSDSYDSFSFNTNQFNYRFKCPLCSNTYKSATAKPCFSHLENKHPSKAIKSHIQSQSNCLTDFDKLLDKDFSVLHLNIWSLPKHKDDLDIIVKTKQN